MANETLTCHMTNEKRLIDANALKQRFDEREAIDIELYGCHIVECFPADDAKEIVDQMPKVDAVEVVHGEWGEIYTCHGERLWGYKCSKCEQDNPNKSNYCPNCGAKMDGGNEDG